MGIIFWNIATLTSSIINTVYELPHELPNNLRLKILRNWEILEKCQNWVKIEPSLLSRNQTFVIAAKNYAEAVYHSFLFLPNFACSFYSVSNILFGIVNTKARYKG